MRTSLSEVAAAFLRLGVVAFGGPAAHIALMEDEFVERRRWISRQHFLDLVGATNLIPGPNSTEMTMHLGYERAGWVGLFTAGACFILPAAAITLGFAWAYVEFGSLPAVEPFLYGIQPAVLAVILAAVWRLGNKAVKARSHAAIGAAVAVAVLAGVGPLTALLIGGVGGALLLRSPLAMPAIFIPFGLLVASGPAVPPSLVKLGLFFLKVGAILYGSGYVLVAFLEGDLVREYGWLSEQQLLDAIAIGQLTPGPVLTTATFIGYLIAGLPGALVATVCIFAPSALFVALANPLIPRLRESAWAAAFLDAVNVSAVALIAAILAQLGLTTLVSWPAWVIAAVGALLLFRWNCNPAWLIGIGAVLGRLLLPWAGA